MKEISFARQKINRECLQKEKKKEIKKKKNETPVENGTQ